MAARFKPVPRGKEAIRAQLGAIQATLEHLFGNWDEMDKRYEEKIAPLEVRERLLLDALAEVEK